MSSFVHIPEIRALLIAPSVCALKDNHDTFIAEVLSSPHIVGLCEVKIKLRRNLGLIARYLISGSWRMAYYLAKNCVMYPLSKRHKKALQLNKKFITTTDVNSDEFLANAKVLDINLLIHSRTRRIFSDRTLAAIKHGCLNIHNGLLPWQKGVKSDLRALARREPTGFTLHWMTNKIDGGPIVKRVVVSDGTDLCYSSYLTRASKELSQLLTKTLQELNTQGLQSYAQNEIQGERMWSTVPTCQELHALRSVGLKL